MLLAKEKVPPLLGQCLIKRNKRETESNTSIYFSYSFAIH